MITTFQEQLQMDLDAVFFNAEAKEFVTKHTISGISNNKAKPAKEYSVIVDNDTLTRRKYQSNSEIENIYLGELLFYIKKQDLDFTPKIDNALIFDGKRYTISDVNNNNGIYEITLSSNNG